MNEAPLNYLQQYILRRQEERPGVAMFNLAKLFKLRKGIDLARLAKALETAGRSHQALRTTLHRYPDDVTLQVQGIDDDEIVVEIVKVTEKNLLARRNSYIKIFDIYDEGLVDAMIFDCGESAYLLSNIHHLVCDGFSFPVILNDARKAWDGEALEEDKYYAMLAKREARARTPVAIAARKLMQEVLKSKDFAQLPRYDMSHSPGYGMFEVPIDIPGDFETFLEAKQASRHHIFLSCAALALAKLTDANDVAIDWVFHGRLTRDELRTVGAFMVDLPFPLTEIADKTPNDIIFAAKHWTFFGIKNGNSIAGEDGENSAERLTFVYQDTWGELMSPGRVDPDGPFGWMIEETIPLRQHQVAAENPFNVEIIEHKGETKLMLEYDSGRYKPETLQHYAALFMESFHWLLGK